MKQIGNLSLIASLLLLSGCSTSGPFSPVRIKYSLTEPVQPRMYSSGGFSQSKNEPRVESLTPTLEWKPVPGNDVKYDLAIHLAYKQRRQVFTRGPEVYFREGLSTTQHAVEVPLRPKTYHCWSVRTRINGVVSGWATYDMERTDAIVGDSWVQNAWWTFATP